MPTDPGLLEFLLDLQRNAEARRQTIQGAPLEESLAVLRTWQTRRLALTYTDLLETEEYGPACRFFLSDIYSAKDFSQRDADAERLYELLTRFLPTFMLHLLADTLRLNQLSNELDYALAQALSTQLGVTDTITPELYAGGYIICDNYPARKKQIELLDKVLREAIFGAHSPLVGVTLRLARQPARHAGWHELHDFLERGYQACKPMHHMGYFVDTIRQREIRILERIYANEPRPFEPWL
jgi:hypothetical protein